MSLRDHLETIYAEHGKLTADLVVAAAKPVKHPLHNRFEWNDKVAGHKYRLVQASELIRSVKTIYRDADDTEDERAVRSWHAVRDDGRYEPAERVAEDETLSALVLRQMQIEWQSMHRRYGHMQEFVELVRVSIGSAA